MNVVGHQHVGVDGAAVLCRGFGEFPQVAAIVRIGGEARLTVVSPLHDVLCDAGQIDAWVARHASKHMCKGMRMMSGTLAQLRRKLLAK